MKHESISGKAENGGHVDVLIVGAGLSGIAAAAHLTMECPDKSYAIVEQRANIGGTWDLFRYPGIRSDSDMHTLGYRFKPWLHEKTIADGPTILEYVRETAQEYGILPNIHFGHRILSASWSTADARWTLAARHEDDGSLVEFTANFLFMCAGYYNYDEGYTPTFKGQDDFAGQMVHPQFWPEHLEYTGKRVVVIGSGATAVTIVPVMAETAAKVTMLQRSPTYMISQPSISPFSKLIRKWLPEKLAYKITRFRNINLQRFSYWLARRKPEWMGKVFINRARKALPDYKNFKRDFTPRYTPWEQRLCVVPDDDMFVALRSGKADIVTEHIDHLTPDGIKLTSGEELPADIIVTATGLNLVMMGKINIIVDDKPVKFNEHFAYKGAMFSDIPNFASVFGYVNASWTLKTDIVADYVCRLLKLMDAKGVSIANPKLNNPDMPRLPFVAEFSSGYFTRSLDQLPSNGDRHPWRAIQNYAVEKKILLNEPVDDGVMIFENPPPNTDANNALKRSSNGHRGDPVVAQ